MNNLKEVAKRIKKAKSIAIFTHVSPDFDALGSVYSLYYSLKNMGKNVEVFTREKLNSHQKLLFEDVANHNNCKDSNFDLFICVDVSSLARLGDYSAIFENKKNNTLVIDHHVCKEEIGKFNYINYERSSCCEIIYEVLSTLKCKINSLVASFLFAGLSSDTSSFQNSSTKINCFKTATKLMELGSDIHNVNRTLYETRTVKEIAFKKYLWNNFKIYKDCAYCLVDYKSLSDLKGKKADCDSFSRSLVSIEGVNRSFSIIEEKEGVFKLSMRSKIGYDIRIVAEKFGGGGHVCAAGATVEAKNIQDAKRKVLQAIFESEKN